jgi:hypothetical protein
MTRSFLAFLAVLGCAAVEFAQSSQNTAIPDVTLGDSLGANFDPKAVGTATAEDFDFLVGTWDFRFQQQAERGVYRPTQLGVWTTQKTHDGHIVEDVWRLGTTTNPTITYRIFNPSRHLWEIQGTKPERGGWDDGIAWSRANERYLVQHFNSSGLLARIKYFDITGQSFRWRADGSTDEGKTWTLDLWKMTAARTGAAPVLADLLPRR